MLHECNDVMSFQYSQDQLGFQKLRDASLWFIIIGILSLIGFFAGVGAIINIVALIIFFMFAIPSLRQAFQIFYSTGKDVSQGFTGINLIPIGIIIEILGGIIVAVGIVTGSDAIISIGGIIALLAAVILFIAGLLIGLSIYNVGSFYSNDMLKIGGILIIIPLVSFIGWILTYIASDELSTRLMGGFVPPAPLPPTTLQVYQVGQGIIKADGTAVITLYSSTSLMITSVSIDGTSYVNNQITPPILNPGYNTVTIKFPPIIGSPGNNYTLTIYFSNGQSIKAVVTYV